MWILINNTNECIKGGVRSGHWAVQLGSWRLKGTFANFLYSLPQCGQIGWS
jgi:hypothetical protein